jgi:hypothetical protein
MDVVITYVDGNDPVWQQDYQKYTNVPVMQKRFRDWGTLKYLLRGIEVNMPFIRNVYLVVSHPSQVPAWADTSNLKIVLHEDIIPEEYLPTFNACAIESMTWRIPGLQDRYLEFNDDVMLCAPVSPDDFITEDDKSVCYADKANIPMIRLTRFMKKLFGSKKTVTFKGILANSALLAGNKWNMLRINHNPRALRREFYEQYFAEHPQTLIRNLRYRFRDPDMYLPELLQYTILNNQGLCDVRPVKGNLMYIQPKDRKDYIKEKLNRLNSGNYRFCCFNSIDKASPEDLQAVREWVSSNLKITL